MWHGSKGYFFASVANAVINGLIAPLVLLLNRRLYNMLGSDRPMFLNALYIIAGIVAANVVSWLWNLLSSTYIMPKLTEQLHMHVQTDLFEKARMIELEMYDDTEFYNDFILAMQYADAYATGTVNNFTNLMSNLIGFSGIVALLAYIDSGTMLVMVASAVISMLIGTKKQKINLEMNEKHAPIMRRGSYVNRLFMLPDYAKELRLTDISECIFRDYEKTISEHIGVTRRYKTKDALLGALSTLNSIGVYIAVVIMTLYKFAVLGTVSIGDFSVIVNANISVGSRLGSLAGTVSDLPSNSDQIDRVRALMDYSPSYKDGTMPAPPLQSLELRNVSFSYFEGGEVLHDVSMKISRGEKIAVVGYNGAGKTTLVKLLMRLYDPSSGVITLGGRDIREYELKSYRRLFGVVFQDYKQFALSVAENVLGRPMRDGDEAIVEDALRRAGIWDKISELPDGMYTQMTREFSEDGLVLSGGQSQMLAIASVYAHGSPIVILDEPSSALDPLAERELYRQMYSACEGKTMIFISHRLSSAVSADKVVLIEDGVVGEYGSHEELMRRGGRYAEMFRAQAESYTGAQSTEE